MNKFAIVMTSLAALMMSACNSNKPTASDAPHAEPAQKYLVLYYSQTGATKAMAEALQTALGADIAAIEVEEPYAGTYDETIQRCLAERNSNKVPQIKALEVDPKDYETTFLCYPVWFGTYARPIMGLLEVEDFAGRKVVPMCTFGSGGLEATTADLRKALPEAEVANGYGVRNARIEDMPAELTRFLVENGYCEGEVDSLPEFTEQQPVTAEEAAIFDAACGDYQFPLGSPVTCGHRQLADAVEYDFTAESTTLDGSKALTTIYVLARPDVKPVFTRVVR